MSKPITNKTIDKLKYDLVREGLLSYDNLTQAEDYIKNSTIGLAQALIQFKFISESALLSFIEAKLHIPYVNLDDYTLDKSCLEYVSEIDAKNYRIIPLFKIEDVLTIAMADPLDLFAFNNLTDCLDCKIEPIICSEKNILDAIEKYYGVTNKLNTDIIGEKSNFNWQENLNNENFDDFEAQRTIKAIIYQANIENVQEIFLENLSNGLAVRFKKNHEIFDKGSISILLAPILISNLKTMTGIDSAITEIPQLGRLTIVEESNSIYTSVSTFPTIKGERISIRLYKPYQKLDNLSIDNTGLNTIKSSLNKSGLVIIQGSNLQDRVSLAYSLLASIERKNKNIMTIESTVQYELSDINQCELNEKVGLNIDKIIKFVDFQSPDVIYIEDSIINSHLDFIHSFIQSNKLLIVESPIDNTKNLLQTIENIKNLVSCIITIEEKSKIRVIKP